MATTDTEEITSPTTEIDVKSPDVASAIEPENTIEKKPAVDVVYCGVCTLPPEYCEFGGTTPKCSAWLSKNHPDLYARLYSPDALASNLSTLSADAIKRAEKDSAKKAAKAAAAEQRDSEAMASAKVIIRLVERNKRKFVTTISGLEQYKLKLKDVSKDMGKKFATGASVTKTASGGEEITIQGDLAVDVEEWLNDVHGEVIPEDNIEIVVDKKKNSS